MIMFSTSFTSKQLFQLGNIVATPGAIAATTLWKRVTLIARHHAGDWGVVCADDKATNDEAVRIGERILTAYPIDPTKPCKGYGENCIWVITERDRSLTTLLLPSEY